MPKNKNRPERWIRARSSKQIVIDEDRYEWFAPDGKLTVKLIEYFPPKIYKYRWRIIVVDSDDGIMEYVSNDERKARWTFDRVTHLVTRQELKTLNFK